jgi:hypothetical protein
MFTKSLKNITSSKERIEKFKKKDKARSLSENRKKEVEEFSYLEIKR